MKRRTLGWAFLATLVAAACNLQSPTVPVAPPRSSPDDSTPSPVFNSGAEPHPNGSLGGTAPAEAPLSPVELKKPAPNVTFYDSAGGRHTLDEYKGKFIALVFFAYYCPTCRAEMPERVFDTTWLLRGRVPELVRGSGRRPALSNGSIDQAGSGYRAA